MWYCLHYQLPQDIAKQENIQIISRDGRFATLITGIEGVQWLALQDEIEWLEEKPVSYLQNTVANTIINSDGVMDNTKMTNLNPAWSGLDGDGIIVTVMDSGLDSGINDATTSRLCRPYTRHLLLANSLGSCTWNSPSDLGHVMVQMTIMATAHMWLVAYLGMEQRVQGLSQVLPQRLLFWFTPLNKVVH